ncbi:hypothetical protein C7B65_12935 [Phormidesmis priestleyi ULC007]|uniref:CdiI immunity protein domain-containing protein n=1 Tax=Phormidesmis priestleyi ULC007 TaxID=1920490 RepID=A0A2T1DFE6_9CYAN|nr:hypothetical protein [Phormidesmis priestleyi]PSB19174.1 hypothetical protein C7B65_12935 [Phormidesmis priestleyi ULC007]PZO50026.1 MAG: hypothetical protein DCF14_12880 [Phormidesmis priestleyi]
MTDYELIRLLLSRFFNYENYEEGIKNARNAIFKNPTTSEDWKRIVTEIRTHNLEAGQPLSLVHDGANQVLNENSDAEAYVWLEKMIKNVEREDEVVEKY